MSLDRSPTLAAAVCFALCATPAAGADRLTALSYLAGAWKCEYRAGSQHITYTATFAYAMRNNWVHERDALAGGGGDEAWITYEPATRSWIQVVLEPQRSTTLFRAKGDSSAHLVYRSLYPNAGMKSTFDRVSRTRYTLHFSGTIGGHRIVSVDTCTKR